MHSTLDENLMKDDVSNPQTMICEKMPTSIKERKGIPISFQHSQILSVQFTLASQFTYFRVFVDFWNGETDDLRQVDREVDGQL